MTGSATYLLVVYLAEQRESGPVARSTVAKALDKSPAATTEMLQRLEKRGLITHVPYEGARLTGKGQERAVDLFETYTTLTVFFEEVLGLENHEEEALRLAGTVSPFVAERLQTTLLSEDDAHSLSEVSGPSFLPPE